MNHFLFYYYNNLCLDDVHLHNRNLQIVQKSYVLVFDILTFDKCQDVWPVLGHVVVVGHINTIFGHDGNTIEPLLLNTPGTGP
jgi:hypothetical protein